TSLLLHSGGIPKELKSTDFKHLNAKRIVLTYGDNDKYLTKDRIEKEILNYQHVFGKRMKTEQFQGKHEVNRGFITKESML
ncbi:hypothetical protein LCGC14_2909230, partial [marine sediment metagenome]